MDSHSAFVFDELIKIPISKLKEMVEDYVMYRKSCGLVRSTINNDIAAITHFLAHCDSLVIANISKQSVNLVVYA